jgi:SAM-dependent methyltransferase
MRGLGMPRWGNLRRVEPFSRNFGFDRGTPIDRYYLNKFLDANRSLITGDVLEIQSTGYTRRYGREVQRADSVDINPAVHPRFVCDLARSGDMIPTGRYDCFLLPNTLQHLRELDECLRHALRIVKPGGVLLASAAGFVPLIPDGPDYWRFSASGWSERLQRVWPACDVRVQSHGNCLAAVAAMLGLAVEEITPSELDVSDPQYPVLITVFCLKPVSS